MFLLSSIHVLVRNYELKILWNGFVLIKLKLAKECNVEIYFSTMFEPLVLDMIINMHNHFILYLLIASYQVLLFFLYPIDNPTLNQQLDFSLHLQLLMTSIFTHFYDPFKYLLLVTVTCISKSYHFLMKCNS